MRPRALLSCLGVLAIGCGSDERTMLVVELQTNLSVPAEIDGVALDVTVTGQPSKHFAYALGNGPYTLPFRVGLLAENGQSSAEVTIVASGQKGTTTVVHEDAVVAFLPGQARVLALFLARECIGHACAAATDTCSSGGTCIATRRQSDALPMFDPGKPVGSGNDGSAGADAPIGSDAPVTIDAPVTVDAPVSKDGPGGGNAEVSCACPAESNPCMQGTCEGTTCVRKPVANLMTCPGGVCWDGACCTGCLSGNRCETAPQASACGAGGRACQVCDDKNPCTRDKCTAGSCDVDRITGGTCPTGVCADGVCRCGGQGEPCCANQTCQANLGCHGNTCGNCGADGQDCCPGTAPCAPGLMCNGNQKCGACGGLNQACCTGGTPCRTGICGTNNVCQPCGAVGQPCCASGGCLQDGNLCNGSESCMNGTCKSGTVLNCEDGNPCTSESCIPGSGCQRFNVSNTVACTDDGNRCTADMCDGNGRCVHPPVMNGTGCSTATGQMGVCNQGTCCVPIPCSTACGPRLCGAVSNGCGGFCPCGVGACPDAGH